MTCSKLAKRGVFVQQPSLSFWHLWCNQKKTKNNKWQFLGSPRRFWLLGTLRDPGRTWAKTRVFQRLGKPRGDEPRGIKARPFTPWMMHDLQLQELTRVDRNPICCGSNPPSKNKGDPPQFEFGNKDHMLEYK